MRQRHQLDKDEIYEFDRLNHHSDVWGFWRRAADARGLDLKTIISEPDPHYFTGLPVGHGKHWCYPYPLHVKNSNQVER